MWPSGSFQAFLSRGLRNHCQLEEFVGLGLLFEVWYEEALEPAREEPGMDASLSLRQAFFSGKTGQTWVSSLSIGEDFRSHQKARRPQGTSAFLHLWAEEGFQECVPQPLHRTEEPGHI